MDNKEQLIVSLTTWSARIKNVPVVLDTIFDQSYLPDKVVLNIAFEENIPYEVADYLTKHNIEVYRTADTKVYKKLFPTLLRYPDACVINIDDDFLYPKGMIEDFMRIHAKYPSHPISGNKHAMYGMLCHCGWASLSKLEHFGDFIEQVDEDLIANCPSSDIVCTYFANKSGHPYINTEGLYSTNMPSYNETESYTIGVVKDDGIALTLKYLTERFGALDHPISGYVDDAYMEDTIIRVMDLVVKEKMAEIKLQTQHRIHSSFAYRLGSFLLRPFKKLHVNK